MAATLAPGDRAPDFTLPDQDGTPVALADLLARGPVVLFFYPMASSGGCTKEACHFRDLAAEFAAVGAQRVGISTDDVGAQKAFDANHGFGYPLLSDRDGAVARAYGVHRGLFGKTLPVKRKTFVIGADGLLKTVIGGELAFDRHADDALAALR